MKKESTDFTDQTSVVIYKLGEQSAEVRVLKWAAAIAVTAIFAFLSFLAQQVSALQAGQVEIMERLTRVELRLDAVENRLSAVESRLSSVENQLVDFGQRIAVNEQKIDSHSHL